ncbi:hypothetical protein [Streptomyces sp. WAC 06725]|uniref:hypothetical protein n=1 Tax=Streptomyces sp. WAC 06725 TaxID=2203209 RepID=UPI000F73F584|nr:hypothetical protein [Streptomyces sp. WAC 06725]
MDADGIYGGVDEFRCALLPARAQFAFSAALGAPLPRKWPRDCIFGNFRGEHRKAEPMAVSTSIPWNMFRNALLDFLAPGSDPAQFEGLQIADGAYSALWNDPKGGDLIAWEFANTIPLWGATFRDAAGRRVTDAYHAFLVAVDASAGQGPDAQRAKARANQLSAQLANAHGNVANIKQQVRANWFRFNRNQQSLPQQQRIDYSTWFAQNDGLQLAVAESDYNAIANEWMDWSDKAGGGCRALAEALREYNNPAYRRQVTDPSGATLQHRVWNLVPRLSDFVRQAQRGQGTWLRIPMSSTRSSSTTKSGWGSDESRLGFISLGAGGSGDRIDVDTSSAGFSVTFEAPAFTAIQMTPGPWFNRSPLVQYRNGPFISTSPYGQGRATFFGPPKEEGTFSLMKTTVYVAYQPTIRARINSSAYQQMQEAWNRGAGLTIGPFSFGGQSTTSKTKRDAFSGSDAEVVLQSNAQGPQIVAVHSNIMP